MCLAIPQSCAIFVSFQGVGKRLGAGYPGPVGLYRFLQEGEQRALLTTAGFPHRQHALNEATAHSTLGDSLCATTALPTLQYAHAIRHFDHATCTRVHTIQPVTVIRGQVVFRWIEALGLSSCRISYSKTGFCQVRAFWIESGWAKTVVVTTPLNAYS